MFWKHYNDSSDGPYSVIVHGGCLISIIHQNQLFGSVVVYPSTATEARARFPTTSVRVLKHIDSLAMSDSVKAEMREEWKRARGRVRSGFVSLRAEL